MSEPSSSNDRDHDDDDRGPLRRLGIAAIAVMVIGALASSRFFGPGSESALVGTESPSIDARIIAGEGAEDGDRVTLDSVRGHVVLLDFWASWCEPCRYSVPIVNRVVSAHAGSDLVALGVNVEPDRPASHVLAAHRAFGIAFPAVQDEGWRMQTAFGVRTIPTLVLLDREGIVREVHQGVPDEEWLSARVHELLDH